MLVGGHFPEREYGLGNCQPIGDITFPLHTFSHPEQLRLEVAVGDIKNDWDFWVHPAILDEGIGMKDESVNANKLSSLILHPSSLIISSTLSPTAMQTLEAGGRVLLSLGRGRVSKAMGGEVEVGFSSIFWNTLWTNHGAPHTLGVICQPDHPALALFPTDRYSNYQWQDMMSHSDAIRYDLLSKDIRPIVRIVDDWFTARPLAMLFEVRVGKGAVLVCGADLINDLDARPAARQLRRSLEAYIKSDQCHPSVEIDMAQLEQLILKKDI